MRAALAEGDPLAAFQPPDGAPETQVATQRLLLLDQTAAERAGGSAEPSARGRGGTRGGHRDARSGGCRVPPHPARRAGDRRGQSGWAGPRRDQGVRTLTPAAAQGAGRRHRAAARDPHRRRCRDPGPGIARSRPARHPSFVFISSPSILSPRSSGAAPVRRKATMRQLLPAETRWRARAEQRSLRSAKPVRLHQSRAPVGSEREPH
jgi:hypothetical protein